MAIDTANEQAAHSELLRHRGHSFECVSYGGGDDNVALECVDCSEVLLDYEREPPRLPNRSDKEE